MAHITSPQVSWGGTVLPVVTGLLATGIFAVDTLSLFPDALAVLYVIVVLLSVNFLPWRGVLLVSLACALLAIISYLYSHGAIYAGDPFVRLLVSLSAIATTAFLALKNQSASAGLREQAQLLDLTHDTIFVRDLKDVISYWNQGAESLYGWRSEEAIGRVSHELMQTVFPAPLEEITAQLLGSNRWEGELIHTKRDGAPVTVASRWSVQRNQRGLPVAILETNNDISERKRAEEALRRQANLLEQTHDAILVWAFPGMITYWNRGAEQLYGFSRKEAIGRLSHELLRTEHPMAAELFEKLLERQGTWAGELTQNTRDGQKVTVESRHVLLREADGRRFVMETNRDVTERKRAEERLQRAHVELAHVTRMTTLGEFAASIAHEVNQPLAAIVTNGDICLRLLNHDVPNLEETRAALNAMINNGMRASEIIRRLRALTKKTTPEKVELSINDVVGEVIPLVQPEMLSQRVSLHLELAPTLPFVLGDRIQLQQVIINLVVNAIESMGSVTDRSRELVIRSRSDAASQLIIDVQDTGLGIDPENVKQLFNAFFSTKPSGMGMGLSICRSIVENHGGKLWVSQNPGPGATFHFTLPSYREATL
jgi:PAS domain S-box-containing protein